MDLFDIMAARTGNSGGGASSQEQSDWETKDSSKQSYIKNRPFFEDYETEVTVKEINAITSISDKDSFNYETIGLIEGEKYSFEIVVGDETITTEANAEFYLEYLCLPYRDEGDEDITWAIFDKMKISDIEGTDNSSFVFLPSDDTCALMPTLEGDLKITINGKFKKVTEIKKIDSNFLKFASAELISAEEGPFVVSKAYLLKEVLPYLINAINETSIASEERLIAAENAIADLALMAGGAEE